MPHVLSLCVVHVCWCFCVATQYTDDTHGVWHHVRTQTPGHTAENVMSWACQCTAIALLNYGHRTGRLLTEYGQSTVRIRSENCHSTVNHTLKTMRTSPMCVNLMSTT